MHQKAVLALVVVAVFCLSGSQASPKFWRKYGAIKSMEDCLTVDGFHGWLHRLERALDYCNNQADSTAANPFMALRDSNTKIPAIDSADWQKIMSQFFAQNWRQKRGVTFTANKIRSIKEKLTRKVQVFRCVHQRLYITDSSNRIDRQGIIRQYREIGLSRSFTNDIEKAINTCADFAECLPLRSRSDLPVPADVAQVKLFTHCEKILRYKACLKEDIKPYVSEFDLSGLDGHLDFLDSDAARAAAILYADDKVGQDDFGLAE